MTGMIDVRGLPPEVVDTIEALVASIRQTLPAPAPAAPVHGSQLSAEEWVKRWRAWTASRPRVAAFADDSRESIYDRSGE